MKARIPISSRISCLWLTGRATRNPRLELSSVWRGHVGSMPSPNPNGILFAACDRRYFDRFALDYLAAIRANSGALSAHLHVYDGTDAQLETISDLAQHHPDARITVSRDENAAPELYSPFFFAAGRFVRMAELLESTRSPIVCTDIDVLVRGNLQPFVAGLEGSDIGLYLRTHNSAPWRKVLASTVVALPTEQGRRFLAHVARAVDASLLRRPRHHVDQLVLYYLYRFSLLGMLGPVRCARLPKSVIDWEFHDDSLVWNFKGSRRSLIQQRVQAQSEVASPIEESPPQRSSRT